MQFLILEHHWKQYRISILRGLYASIIKSAKNQFVIDYITYLKKKQLFMLYRQENYLKPSNDQVLFLLTMCILITKTWSSIQYTDYSNSRNFIIENDYKHLFMQSEWNSIIKYTYACSVQQLLICCEAKHKFQKLCEVSFNWQLRMILIITERTLWSLNWTPKNNEKLYRFC